MLNLSEFLKDSPNLQEILLSAKSEGKICVEGASDGEKSLIFSQIEKGIYVVDDFSKANNLNVGLTNLGLKSKILSTIDENCLFINLRDNTSSFELIESIYDFLLGKISHLIVLSSVLRQRLPNRETFLNNLMTFEISKSYNFKSLSRKLVEMGYVFTEEIDSKGEFVFRGDLLYIYPINGDRPLRISFFGNEIENIVYYNFADMKPQEEVQKIDIYPATFLLIDEAKRQNVIEILKNEKVKSKDKLNETLSSVIQILEDKMSSLNIIFALPYFDYKDNILSVCGDNSPICFDSPMLIKNSIDFSNKSHLSSTVDLIEKGELTQKHFEHFLTSDEIFSNNYYSIICFQNINYSKNYFNIKKIIKLNIISLNKYIFDYKLLKNDLILFNRNNQKVLLFSGNDNNYNILREFLSRENILYSNINENKLNILISNKYFPFSATILDANLIIISTDYLFKKDYKIANSSKNKKEVFYLPKVGEYVVHSLHGVGKCVALERLEMLGISRDYFIIEYDKGDKLYLPTEQANTLSAYMGGENSPHLNKIGGLEFSRIKERVKNGLKELAFDLVKLYQERENSKGFQFSKDNYLMEKFEEEFPYEETTDQLMSIRDIKHDMQSTKIMDRLVCGDVGYGKTEVALRAIYKAILDGKQVAFLCPTSILSEQHYNTAKSRFENFMVNVAVLNRLKSSKEQSAILDKLQLGKIDLIIGTHRLLSQDVHFKNLGLLVLDEEQRFGVGDKEKIKNLKKDIDVLTLSATPIPRTLHMSLTGIRDISIIETPPKDRLPIQTYVTEFSDTLLVDVCKRELARGGQVLVVYNRVDKILDFKNRLQSLLPDVSIGYAHGQMASKELENSILKLYNNEYQIMVATTLIENGIDLPLANTLFVVDSDRLGLSQLYQLRGRIGRSNRLAYAYFTFDGDKVLTEDAYKRLEAITEFTELGSGFKIAMRDLEIRGAGNVLGKEQHGHMEKVGYAMYSELLKDAISELKGEKTKEILPVKIDVSLSAFIPENYIKTEEQRIKAYSAISEITNEQECIDVLNKLNDTYGELPNEVRNLGTISLLKHYCEQVDVKNCVINDSTCELRFYKKEEIISESVAKALEQNNKHCVLKIKELPIISFDYKSIKIKQKIDLVIEFLKQCLN